MATAKTAVAATAPLKVSFLFEKDTPHTGRYKEVVADGQTALVGTLYVQKATFPAGMPTTLTVTIE